VVEKACYFTRNGAYIKNIAREERRVKKAKPSCPLARGLVV